VGKLPTTPDISNLNQLPDVVRFVSQFMKNTQDLISGNLNFKDNFKGQIKDVLFVSGEELVVGHNLNYVPTGYVVLKTSVPMSIYQGVAPWSNINIFITSNASGSATILIL
jgi:hypothetical protein